MSQAYYFLILVILPIIVGLLLGICLWKLKKAYFLSGFMLLVSVVWWCVLSHINTHGSEGPGLLLWMYSFTTLAFTVVEIIKFVVRKLKARS